GSCQEIIIVEYERGIVLVVVEADLDGVAGLEEILAVQIADEHLPLPVLKAVQTAIGVLVEHREVRGVVLVAIVAQVAEDADAGFLVVEDEAAEIAVEGLDAGAHGNK